MPSGPAALPALNCESTCLGSPEVKASSICCLRVMCVDRVSHRDLCLLSWSPYHF